MTTTAHEEIEQLKAAISLKLSDDDFVALLDELDRAPDRIGFLKAKWSELSEPAKEQHAELLSRHGLSIEQEVGRRTVQDRRTNQVSEQEVQRGWALIRTQKGTSVRSGKTGAWVPYHHPVLVPYTTKAEAERAAILYADHLEREANDHRVPVKQVVLRLPIALKFDQAKIPFKQTNVDLDLECRTALNALLGGLRAGNFEMSSGHRVDTLTHAIRWLMEQIHAKM